MHNEKIYFIYRSSKTSWICTFLGHLNPYIKKIKKKKKLESIYYKMANNQAMIQFYTQAFQLMRFAIRTQQKRTTLKREEKKIYLELYCYAVCITYHTTYILPHIVNIPQLLLVI